MQWYEYLAMGVCAACVVPVIVVTLRTPVLPWTAVQARRMSRAGLLAIGGVGLYQLFWLVMNIARGETAQAAVTACSLVLNFFVLRLLLRGLRSATAAIANNGEYVPATQRDLRASQIDLRIILVLGGLCAIGLIVTVYASVAMSVR